MAIVTYALGDCPSCGRKNGFGNVDVFGGAMLYRGCEACEYNERVPLPPLHKKVAYLDQFFFSGAFRGGDSRFVEAVRRLERMSALQLVVAPYSSIHEDETHQWAGRDALFKFIKSTSRGHKFQYAPEVRRMQLLRAFQAWRAHEPAAGVLVESDALRPEAHHWDSMFRLEVGRYTGDTELIRSLKTQTLEGLIELFAGWRELTTTFEQDLAAEYDASGRGLLAHYVQFLGRMMQGDTNALLDAPAAGTVVQSMVRLLLQEGVPASDCLNICSQFLRGSPHVREVPSEWLSAHIHATLKAMVKAGKFTNEEQALKKFRGYYYDVEHIATYAPYCDVIVLDQVMADLVRQPTVDLYGRYGTRVFSLNNWGDFLAWLDSLEQAITPEHRAALELIHPAMATRDGAAP